MDINTIDGALQTSASDCLAGILDFLVSFSVILYVVPSFVPYALFIAWLYVRLAIRASRDLRRLESISLSPAFAGFDELLRGIVHIRAFAMENRYQEKFQGPLKVGSLSILIFDLLDMFRWISSNPYMSVIRDKPEWELTVF
jgi:hypothetical protein